MRLWVVAMLLGGALVEQGIYAQGGSGQDKDITGNWQGTLQAGNGLRTVLKIANDDGKLKATMYSVDQGGQAIPVTAIALQGTAFSYAIKPLDLTYAGTLNPEGTAIAGSATQGGQAHVLNYEHVTEENTWTIPKPLKPMPADATPGFEVVTIKPGQPGRVGKGIGFNGHQFRAINMNVNDLLGFAYSVQAKQILGAPAWFDSDLYDIDGVPDVEGRPSQKQIGIMLQKLLADRFQLVFHRDKKELSVYAVEVGKGGPKMTKTASAPNDPPGFGFRKLGDLTVRNLTMADFATWMQTVLDKPVVDQSGLTDRYDFTLSWTPDNSQFAQFRSAGATVAPPTDDPNAPPSLYTAMQEQLGMKLEPVKAPADVIVIDRVEKPSAN
jgi:uncharacterized protein (TIGR03435 family)